MKKTLFTLGFSLLLVAGGITCYKNLSTTDAPMSTLIKANLEALSQNEGAFDSVWKVTINSAGNVISCKPDGSQACLKK